MNSAEWARKILVRQNKNHLNNISVGPRTHGSRYYRLLLIPFHQIKPELYPTHGILTINGEDIVMKCFL